MYEFKNLGEVLIGKSKIKDKGITFIYELTREYYVSYDQLYQNALKYLGALQRKGLKKGCKLIFQVRDNKHFVFTFWACMLGGIIPVPVVIGNKYEHRLKLIKIMQIIDNPYMLIDQSELEKLKAFMIKEGLSEMYEAIVLEYIYTNELDESLEEGEVVEVETDETAFIQFSSGSTGTPKGVVLTHKNLLANIQGIINASNMVSKDVILSWMPLTHDMGLIGCHLTAVVAGFNQYNIHTDLFIRNPVLWLIKANEHQATLLTSPNFGYQYFMKWFKPEIAKDWDLSHIRIIYNGAEPISIDLCNKFIETLRPYHLNENVIFPVYGLAEASLAVTFPKLGEKIEVVQVVRDSLLIDHKVEVTCDEKNAVKFVGVGSVIDGCEVRICNEQNEVLPDEFVGSIQIKGDNVTKGYFKNLEETAKVLSEDGWLDTGDIGFLNQNRLVITGRKKDILFVNGQNYYPFDLEEYVEKVKGVKEGGSVVCGVYNQETKQEEVGIFVLHRKSLEQFVPIAQEIKRFINDKVGIEVKHVLPVKTIFKTTSGKKQHYVYSKKYEQGEYEEAERTLNQLYKEILTNRKLVEPSNVIEEKLVTFIKENLDVEMVGVTGSFFELGINSLKAARLVNYIGKMFEVNIPLSEVFTNPTIRGLAEYIQGAEKTEYVAVNKSEEKAYYELSSAQKRMYVMADLEKESTMYNLPGIMSMKGDLNLTKLEESLNQLIMRHEALRTSFCKIGGEPYQKISPELTFKLKLEEIEQEQLDDSIKQFIRPFDLEKAPLMHVEILKTAQTQYYFLFDIHHIIADGISINIIIKELSDLYNGVEPSQVEFQYKDFVLWQNSKAYTQAEQTDKSYWLETFKGEIPVLNLPVDFKRPVQQSYKGNKIYFEADESLTKHLEALSCATDTTLYMVLLAAYNILLAKYTQQEDIIVGSPASGRIKEEFSETIGMFVNTFPMRNKPIQTLNFKTFLAQVKQNAMQAFEHQAYQFERLVEDLKIKRDLSRHPVFDVLFTLQNMDSSELALQDMVVQPYQFETKTAQFDLSLDVIKKNEKLYFELEYCTTLFKKQSVEQMSRHLLQLLKVITDNPELKIMEMELLSVNEREMLINDFNRNQKQYDMRKCLHELFEEHALKTPDKLAVICREEKESYQCLNKKANQLAWYMQRENLEENKIVAVMLERSCQMVEAILAIWKVGGAYIPLDVSYPVQRLIDILEDSQAKTLITMSSYVTQTFRATYKGKIIYLDEIILSNEITGNLNNKTDIDALAYILFTSGSTGKPKGAMIEHRGMLNHIFAQQDELNLNEQLIFAQNASHCFDISVWQFFAPLALGGTTVICPNELVMEPKAFIRTIQENKVSLLEVVPSYLMTLMECIEEDSALSLESIQYLMITGEAVKYPVIKKWFSLYPNIKMVNAYGPAEASDDITQYIMSECPKCDEDIPIGKPLNNINIYIVDKNMQLVPMGVVGEICVSGISVGRGYINQPEKTKAAFIDDPFNTETKVRMYKTGDLGKWLPDGTLVFKGRKDYQVKVRGFRIELGEIENALVNYVHIKNVAVVTKQDPEENVCICAYFDADEAVEISELKRYLTEVLPAYMVPAYFMQMSQLPLLPNGKVNHKELPSPQMTSEVTCIAPRNEIEEKLLGLWQEVLKTNSISMTDDFFDIGGQSLKAAKLASRIHKVFNVELPTKDIFMYSTIEKLALHLNDFETGHYEKITKVEEKAYYELSSAQRRLYVLDSFENNSTMYNMPGVVVMKGVIDKERLLDAFNQLIKRHETLRTSFTYIDNEPYQIIHDAVDFEILYEQVNENEIDTAITGFVAPFDLTKVPLLRVKVMDVTQDMHYMCFDMHHIISDGVAIDILVTELSKLYNNEQLQPLEIQYKDFAKWQNDLLKCDEIKEAEAYWLNEFSEEVVPLNLPTDYARPAVQSFEGDRIYFEADEMLTKELKALVKETNTTLYMMLLAAYNVLLGKYTGQDDIVVGSPVAGRQQVELENIIGMFVNTLAIRNIQNVNETFLTFLGEVKEKVLKAMMYQDYQFEQLVEKVEATRDISRNPLFDTMFTMQNTENAAIQMAELKCEIKPIDFKVSKFDLSLDAVEKDHKIVFELEYCTALFKRETAYRICEHFINILKAITVSPSSEISKINYLSASEQEMLLNTFAGEKVNYDLDKLVHQRFEEYALKQPEKVAVSYENQKVTYDELNKSSNQIAAYLVKSGLKAENIVCVMLERSPLFIRSVMGIWKAGGAYMPIDISYPVQRKLSILKDSKANKIITLSKYRDELLEAQYEGEILYLDLLEIEIAKESYENLNILVTKNQLAYVLFTSGSTGKPKGVMIEHMGMLNHILAEKDILELDETLVFAQNANQCFDISVWQFFAALALGGTTAIYSNELILEAGQFVETICKEKVTLLEAVPSYLMVMMDYIEKTHITLENLRYVIATGESVKVNVIKRWFNLCPSIKLVNAYGPAEASDDVTQYVMSSAPTQEHMIIGKPLNNINIYIVNLRMELCPIGVEGEICISGIGVGRGYINNPKQTQDTFIEDPFRPNEHIRLYKTGDMGKWLADGNIAFSGRRDAQVKVRGFRIELGEIESHLSNYEAINDAVAVIRQDNKDNNYICAYYTAQSTLDVEELKQYLLDFVPEYMVPSHFMQLDTLPMSANGKVDRKSLPEPQLNLEAHYELPQSVLEEKLVEVWENVLGIEQVGVQDNFFSLGGDSIKAIKVASSMMELGYKVEVRQIFEYPVISALSKVIKVNLVESFQGNVVGEVKLSPIQKGFFKRHNLNGNHYNQSFICSSIHEINIDLLKEALDKLMVHHDALRMSYYEEEGRIIQYNRGIEDTLYHLKKYDLTGEIDFEPSMLALAEELQREINLVNGPLVNVGVFKTLGRDYILIVIHHLIVDGVSWRILIEDLDTVYNALINNEAIHLPKKTTSYQEWTNKLETYAESKALLDESQYWLKQCTYPISKLPRDYDEDKEKRTYRSNKEISIVLGREETQNLLMKCHETYHTEINELLLVALGLTVKEWANIDYMFVNLEGHGREEILSDVDLTRTVGWFTTEYPVLLDMSRSDDLSYTIRTIKEEIRHIPNKGIGYGILKYLSQTADTTIKQGELAEINFNYLGDINALQNGKQFMLTSINTGKMVGECLEREFLLDMNGLISDERFIMRIEYSEQDFEEATIRRFLESYMEHLKMIIMHCMNKEEVEITPDDVGYEMSIDELDDLVDELEGLLDD